jgi:hypothetical protein
MSTLDDLRTTLDRHASGLPDDHLPDRSGAVRERVRVVRRRRKAGAAGTLAVVLAVVGGAVLGLHGADRPADRELAGATAPATLRSLGYTYAFDRGVEGAGSATVRLPASDRPRLVSWATSGRDRVTVTGPYGERYDSLAGDFGDFQLVPEGDAVRVTVAGDGVGEVGLAVYEPTDAAPPGVTVDGTTYRDEVGDQRLVGAAIGRSGENRVSGPVRVVAGRLRAKIMCSGFDGTAWVHLEIAGRPAGTLGGRGACQRAQDDPGAEGTYTVSRLTDYAATGDTVDVSVTVTTRQAATSAPVTGDDLRVGVGLYRPGARVRVGGQRLDRIVEDAGHTYRVLAAVDARTRSTEVTGLPPRGRLVFAVTYASDGLRGVRLRHGGHVLELGSSSRGGTVSQASRGLGSRAVLEFGGDNPSDHLGLTVYGRVD